MVVGRGIRAMLLGTAILCGCTSRLQVERPVPIARTEIARSMTWMVRGEVAAAVARAVEARDDVLGRLSDEAQVVVVETSADYVVYICAPAREGGLKDFRATITPGSRRARDVAVGEAPLCASSWRARFGTNGYVSSIVAAAAASYRDNGTGDLGDRWLELLRPEPHEGATATVALFRPDGPRPQDPGQAFIVHVDTRSRQVAAWEWQP